MSEATDLILYERIDRVAVITLNRPEKRNAMSDAAFELLDAAFKRAEDDPEIRAIVLAGAGKSFCAGADLGRAGSEGPRTGVERLGHFEEMHDRQFRFWECTKPIICAIHGHALGRGLELALMCDIIIASEEAKLGQPEVREGWVLWSVVPWLVNPQKAKLFMISGDTVLAAEAERMGLVTQVVPEGTAREAAIKCARRLSHIPPLAAQSIKRMVNGVTELAGFREQQAQGVSVTALIASLSPEEKGVAELVRVRAEQGVKASIEFRDAPFRD